MIALRELAWGSPQDAEILAAIADTLQFQRTRRTMTEGGLVAITALAACPLPGADEVLGATLQAADWRATISAADVIARRESGGKVLDPLRAAWNSPVAAENYALRQALVLAIADGRGNEGVAATIALLPELTGQLRFEAVARLTQRTGQNLGDNAEEWQAWWTQRPAGWTETLLNREELPKEVPWNRPVPEFYGVKIYAQRVLFVVDVSNSMRSTLDGRMRMETAQEELKRAITALPSDGWFDVILYNDQVRPWRGELVPATLENRATAIQMIYSADPARRTAINDAMELAVEYPLPSLSVPGYVEQAILVSDGKPTAGRILPPQAIVTNITARNHLKRIRIDTVGIDTEGEPEQFLQALAGNNFGTYYKLR